MHFAVIQQCMLRGELIAAVNVLYGEGWMSGGGKCLDSLLSNLVILQTPFCGSYVWRQTLTLTY